MVQMTKLLYPDIHLNEFILRNIGIFEIHSLHKLSWVNQTT